MPHGQFRQVAAEIVFRQACLAYGLDQPPRPLAPAGRRLTCDQGFEIAWPRRVVVDALRIRDEREGRNEFGAKSARTQETILDPQSYNFV